MTDTLTITAALDALRDNRLRSVDLLARAFTVAEALDHELGIYLARFEEHAYQAAEAADKLYSAGDPAGALAGIPIGIKDVISSIEGPTTAQSLILDPAWGGLGGRRDGHQADPPGGRCHYRQADHDGVRYRYTRRSERVSPAQEPLGHSSLGRRVVIGLCDPREVLDLRAAGMSEDDIRRHPPRRSRRLCADRRSADRVPGSGKGGTPR